MATVYDALRVLTPTAVFAVRDNTYAGIEWFSPEIPMPTEQEVAAEQTALDAQAPIDTCKEQASKLLYETDWTTIPDVGNPAVSTPYLVNVQDFVTYRNAVRQLAVYPVANPTFPTIPNAVWG